MAKQVNVRLTDDVYLKLKEIAKLKGKLSVPELIRDLITDFLERYEFNNVIKGGR